MSDTDAAGMMATPPPSLSSASSSASTLRPSAGAAGGLESSEVSSSCSDLPWRDMTSQPTIRDLLTRIDDTRQEEQGGAAAGHKSMADLLLCDPLASASLPSRAPTSGRAKVEVAAAVTAAPTFRPPTPPPQLPVSPSKEKDRSSMALPSRGPFAAAAEESKDATEVDPETPLDQSPIVITNVSSPAATSPAASGATSDSPSSLPSAVADPLVALSSLAADTSRRLTTIGLLAALESSTDVFGKLDWLTKTLVHPQQSASSSSSSACVEVDFGLVRHSTSICGEAMKLAALVFALPPTRPGNKSAATLKATAIDQLQRVLDVLLKQLGDQSARGLTLTGDARQSVVNHILQSRGLFTTETNQLMHRLLRAVMVDSHGSVTDCTPALLHLAEAGFIEFVATILARGEPFRQYNLVVDPFALDGSGCTLEMVLRRRLAKGPTRVPPPLHTHVALQLLVEMRQFVLGPLVDVLEDSFDVELESCSGDPADLSPDEVGAEVLTFFDCFGRATDKLKQIASDKRQKEAEKARQVSAKMQ